MEHHTSPTLRFCTVACPHDCIYALLLRPELCHVPGMVNLCIDNLMWDLLTAWPQLGCRGALRLHILKDLILIGVYSEFVNGFADPGLA